MWRAVWAAVGTVDGRGGRSGKRLGSGDWCRMTLGFVTCFHHAHRGFIVRGVKIEMRWMENAKLRDR